MAAQAAQGYRDILRIRQNSEAVDNQEEAPGTTVGLREQGVLVR
jgi:hypothetical protein